MNAVPDLPKVGTPQYAAGFVTPHEKHSEMISVFDGPTAAAETGELCGLRNYF
jgi:hypothetical protein